MHAGNGRFVVTVVWLAGMTLCPVSALSSQPTSRDVATVSGWIVDYQARPVEGAEVALYEETHDFTTDRDGVRLLDEIRRTDSNGRFTFAADVAPSYRVFIVARKAGLALGWDVLTQPADNAIVLERPCVLGGVVVDASGRAVSGAKVRAVPKTSYLRRLTQNPILGPEPWLTVETDSQGRFRFDNFAADVSSDFWVEVPGRAMVYTYTPHWLTIIGSEAGQTDIRLALPEETAVRGRVVEQESGKPVEGASVVLRPDMIRDNRANPYLPKQTISDADGRFIFEQVSPGKHHITISTPYEAGLVDRRVQFEVRPGVDFPGVDISLCRGGVIELEAREERTNEPIAGLDVYFREAVQDEQSSFYKDARTDAEGMLRIQAPAGLCKFITQPEGYSPFRYEDQAVVVVGRTTKSRIALRRYPIVSGFVSDEQGRPLRGAMVNHGTTDSAGRFEVPFPSEESPFGRWIARYEPGNLAAVLNVERDDEPVEIALRPVLAVSGRVVDPNGVGISAARVSLDIRAAGQLTPYGPEVLTDSRGRFEIKAVVPEGPEFDYRISVNACGYGAWQYQRISIEGEPGEQVQLDPVVLLPADQSITGTVVDSSGKLAAGVPICARGRDQSTRYAVTDEAGRFTVRRVCKGALRIQAGFSSIREETGTLQLEGGDRDVRVILGEDGVHLRYASLVGKPLPIEDFDLGNWRENAEGKMILLCLLDMQQRPSRNMAIELAGRTERFSQQGVAVAAVQISKVDRTELEKWVADSRIAFPIHMVEPDEKQVRLAWGVQALPWLILTDRSHLVVAEGSRLAQIEQEIDKTCAAITKPTTDGD